MFDKVLVREALAELTTLPHEVRVLSPHAFEIRPLGFARDVPGYRVTVSRGAFRLKADVVPDPLSVALRSAIVAGARNVPGRMVRLKDDIARIGWVPRVDLGPDTFVIGATDPDAPHRSPDEQIEQATAVAVALSEFVLDQLVVTRPSGETRPAVERNVAEGALDGEPWEYDPSERDRATARHRALENWLITTLREAGIEPLDPASEPLFDLAWILDGTFYVCEVKTISGAEVKQLRLGLGQVLHYSAELRAVRRETVCPVLLVESRPADGIWGQLTSDLGVLLVWPGAEGRLLDPASPDTLYPTIAER